MMADSGFESVDEYIASQPEALRGLLELVRDTIRKAIPKAEESISYIMPTYKLAGAPVLYFAAWKRHYSLYPVTGRLIEAIKDDLAPYKVNMGTIRFPLTKPVPVALIRRIANFRAKKVTESAMRFESTIRTR